MLQLYYEYEAIILVILEAAVVLLICSLVTRKPRGVNILIHMP